MNRDAGRGNWLFVTLRLGGDDELLFQLDTGASVTCLDKSLESRLGECRGKCTSWHFGAETEANVYPAPKIYWEGSTLLNTGSNVLIIDLKRISSDAGYPIKGILGMDILQNYCLQFDFKASRIRFIRSQRETTKRLGKKFSLGDAGDKCPVISENLVGGKSPGSLIDTGYNTDGWLTAALFDQWTNPCVPSAEPQINFPNGLFAGESYSNLDLTRLETTISSSDDSHMKFNGLGLRFLARHLVTFDFPGHTMYLKQTSNKPLSLTSEDWSRLGKSALKFLHRLKNNGLLPGWSKSDTFATKSATFHSHSIGFGTLDFQKKGDSSTYHYQVIRASEKSPWKLKKAWRTEKDGQTIKM